ncbi:hypothetical protein GCM10027161_07890 [Microbispora hainanensis]
MATPHVAGTAALVKQRHPAWGAQRLKDALMGTVTAAAGPSPYGYGTGRATPRPRSGCTTTRARATGSPSAVTRP